MEAQSGDDCFDFGFRSAPIVCRKDCSFSITNYSSDSLFKGDSFEGLVSLYCVQDHT